MKRVVEEVEAFGMENLNKKLDELDMKYDNYGKVIDIKRSSTVQPFKYVVFIEYRTDG